MNHSRSTLLLIGSLLALPSCTERAEQPGSAAVKTPAAPPVEVTVVHPHRGDIARTITLPATVVPYQRAMLCAKVAGYLKTIAVDQGDAVKEGDVLAEIEVPELIAELAKTKAEAEVAALEYRRIKEAQGKAPDLVMAQSVDNAKARLDVAKASLERTTTLLGYTRITAPFSGTITRRFVDPGAFIAAPTSTAPEQNAALLSLMDFSQVRVRVAIPENEVPLIVKGVPARVQVGELPNRVFEGSVTRYAHGLDDATRTMLAEVQLPNPDAALRPGMFATIQLAVEQRRAALLLPAQAVVIEKAKTSVFLRDGARAKKVSVKTGFQNSAAVEILEGAGEGDSVLVPGKQALADGQEVVVKEAK